MIKNIFFKAVYYSKTIFMNIWNFNGFIQCVILLIYRKKYQKSFNIPLWNLIILSIVCILRNSNDSIVKVVFSLAFVVSIKKKGLGKCTWRHNTRRPITAEAKSSTNLRAQLIGRKGRQLQTSLKMEM